MPSSTHLLMQALLRLFAINFNLRPSLRKWLSGVDGPIEFSVGFRTESGSARGGLEFRKGRVRALGAPPAGADVVLVYASDEVVRDMLRLRSSEVLTLLLRNRMRTEGNLSYLSLFNFYAGLLRGGKNGNGNGKGNGKGATAAQGGNGAGAGKGVSIRPRARLRGERVDPGVRFLDDPYLSHLDLEDFPRLQRFLDLHFTVRPEICPERAKLLTDWHRAHGFETDEGGRRWSPVLRQGHALAHLLSHRRPIIRAGAT